MTTIGSTTPGVDWTAIRDTAVGAAARGWAGRLGDTPGERACPSPGAAPATAGRGDPPGRAVNRGWAGHGTVHPGGVVR